VLALNGQRALARSTANQATGRSRACAAFGIAIVPSTLRKRPRLISFIKRARVTAFACASVCSVAAPALAASAEEAPKLPTRSVWLAATYDFLLTSAFDPSSRHGLGASAAYEFHLSPRFNLGLTLAYRLYPGGQATQQIGYGTTLKHFFSDRWATTDGFYPFVDYGLLLQQTSISGREGSATSHDTRLGVGAVLRTSGVAFFVDLGGHFSRLNFFDRTATFIPYLEAQVGCVLPF
jgi:hypothetical protein